MTNCKGRSTTTKINGKAYGGESFVNWTINLNTVQSDKFLNLLLSMVPIVYHKKQEERHKKVNGVWQDGLQHTGHNFNVRSDQHMEYHHFSEPAFHGSNGHSPSSCSPKYDDFASYNYCDGMDTSETDAILQDDNLSSDGDEDAIVERSRKQPKESSSIMALQILVPFLLAGFGTVSAGMVLDIVQVNVGKMDSPIEKWNLIIGNLALKQVQATVVGFLAAVAAVTLGWIPEGKYRLDHSILLCSSSVATAFIASLLQGESILLIQDSEDYPPSSSPSFSIISELSANDSVSVTSCIIMVGVIVGSKKTGINPDNVATPIAASFGDLITLAILAWISQGLYDCLETYYYVSPLVGAFFLALTPMWIVIAAKHPATRTVLYSGWEPVITAMLISSIGGLILDTTVSDPNLVGIVVYTPVINGIGGNLVAIQASRISTYLHLHSIPGELPEEAKGCYSPCRTYYGTAPIGLQRQTAACGSCNRPNRWTQQDVAQEGTDVDSGFWVLH
ncbi:Solute carrier family 41 member 2 [Chelonia mydas]|uniref:Solute carrier family 41 member n=1 Tax=Chelonia mydas TaxID=8469 RepID=M7BCM0_CHEMY|nr:Solute carrier family 41 member 2 [Chelonia mydas]